MLAPNAKLRASVVPGPAQDTSIPTYEHVHGLDQLLKRVFDLNLQHCPQRGGNLKISAAIEQPARIAKILTYLGLPAWAPPRSLARWPELFQEAKAITALQRG